MTRKGCVVIKYSGPHLPEGAFEAWEASIRASSAERWPIMQSMGATNWTLMNDSHRNAPRNMLIVEFESEEQAKQWHASEAGAEGAMKWVAAGTLDMSWNVFGIASRG